MQNDTSHTCCQHLLCVSISSRQPGWPCRLELQTRNNGKLMATLEEVLGRLEVPEDSQDLLEQTELSDAR